MAELRRVEVERAEHEIRLVADRERLGIARGEPACGVELRW